jgi:ribosome-associated toxin RatA of RatAB toxin-antitoxin module
MSNRPTTLTYWVVSHNGQRYEFDTEISEQRPDERVAWKTTDGKSHAGAVTFHRLDEDSCKIMVQMDWEPEGMLETLGSALGSDDRRGRRGVRMVAPLFRTSRRARCIASRAGRS